MDLSLLKVGDVITVHHWEPYSTGITDRSYVGECLTVLAVDSPFVVVRGPWSRPITLDSRMVTLQRMSPEVVAVYAGEKAQHDTAQ